MRKVATLLVLIQSFQLITCQGYFTVVGSKFVRYQNKYHVSVTSQGYTTPQILEVAIRNSDKTKQTYEVAKNVTLVNGKLQMIELDLKDQIISDQMLEVKSVKGDKFEKRAYLDINTKKSSVFIQTDKAIYKATDKVRFRVIFLDPDLRPLRNPNVSIFITDAERNRVKQYEKIFLTKGVFESEFQLSELANLGMWRINVKVNGGKDVVKEFDVKKYVLPIFEIKIDTNSDTDFKQGKVRATVLVKYTFGKIAKGTATVRAEYQEFYPFMQPSHVVTKTVDVDGKKVVEFDMESELKIKVNTKDACVLLVAVFKDELTGHEANATAKVMIHPHPFKIEFIESSSFPKPGLPFTVTAVVKSYENNAPITDTKNQMEIESNIFYMVNPFKPYGVDSRVIVQQRKFISNGIVKIENEIRRNVTIINVKVKYLGVEAFYHRSKIFNAHDNSPEFVQVRLLTEDPRVSGIIQIGVKSTMKLNEVTYQVMGRCELLKAGIVPVDNKDEFQFEFTTTSSMYPRANVVVYFISSDGDIVSDHLVIEFRNDLSNKIDISLSESVAKPGDSVTITANTAKNAFVGLIGVDQSVLLLKSGNDIHQSTVLTELQEYQRADFTNSCTYCSSNDETSGISSFISSNAVLISNTATIYSPKRKLKSSRTQLQNGPSAMASEDGGQTSEIRTELPEVWFFESFNLKSGNSEVDFTKTVPDTITSWIITGFSVDPITGLGLSNLPTKLTVFRPFFLSINLPYSVKRGEIVSIPVSVFNYMDKDEVAEITLFNNAEEFEFAMVNGEEHLSTTDTERKKSVNTKAQSGVTVNFLIRPLKVGHITIKVIGTTATAGDGLEKQLIVEPVGVTQYMNRAVLIDLRNTREFKSTLSITVPANAVPDSTKIEASAIGDVMGPSLENLDDWLLLPGGCGEQNLFKFVSNVVVIEYLTTVKKLTSKAEAKAKLHLEMAYQVQLRYKKADGSYVGLNLHEIGSTFLTAYTAKTFHQAAKFTFIDKNVTNQALAYLSSVQAKDGSFKEFGRNWDSRIKQELAAGLTLTAYTLATFLENSESLLKYQSTVTNALNYIASNVDKINDAHTLAVVAYTLQLAKHPLKDSVLKRLDDKSINKDGMKFWTLEDTPSYYDRNAINNEVSAYGLKAFLLAGKEIEAIAVSKWLITQRNANGGWVTTKDTAVAIRALGKLALRVHALNTKININIKPNSGKSKQITINEYNLLVLQKVELSNKARIFDIIATGQGLAFLQIAYQYNVDNSGEFPRFKLVPKLNNKTTKTFIALEVCTSFIPDKTAVKSNMAIMEVTFPSGFVFDTDTTAELLAFDKVKKVELKNGDTLVIVYFDAITTDTVCPVFKANRLYNVALQKPASVKVYDYYDNSRSARAFYAALGISLCDICTSDDCKKICPKFRKQINCP